MINTTKFIHDLWALLRPYWRSEERRSAWLLLEISPPRRDKELGAAKPQPKSDYLAQSAQRRKSIVISNPSRDSG